MDLAIATTPSSCPPLADLAPLLRRIFWLVHTVRAWPRQPSPPAPSKDLPHLAEQPPVFILASAPFKEWSEVARQIQNDIKPEAWNIERKIKNGETPRTIISLRKDQHNYEVQILPLRGFKPARFFYDYQRGWYLNQLTKLPTAPQLLQISPTGLYLAQKLVITNPGDLKKFFGLTGTALDPSYTPAQLYAEIAASPFFDPDLFFRCAEPPQKTPAAPGEQHTSGPPHSPEPTDAESNITYRLPEFRTWWAANHSQASTTTAKARFSRADIEERIHYINLGLEIPSPL